MGVVVAAEHIALGGRVAIKYLQPEALSNAEIVERFLREGRAARRIQSDHVARVFDVGTLPDGAPYLVMEHLDGEDLGALLASKGPLPIMDVVGYVLETCEALAEAHHKGIVHRDLKPSNLFLTRMSDGTSTIKVIDFGVSKVMPTAVDPGGGHITRTAVMMGSPYYMAPEQMSSARDVDPRADIWSLGIILYQLLAGDPPFVGETLMEIYDAMLAGPKPLRVVRAEVPEVLEQVIARCLRRKVSERWNHVGELAAALAPFGPSEAWGSVERIKRSMRASIAEAKPAKVHRGTPSTRPDAPTMDATPRLPEIPKLEPPPVIGEPTVRVRRQNQEAPKAEAPKIEAPKIEAPKPEAKAPEPPIVKPREPEALVPIELHYDAGARSRPRPRAGAGDGKTSRTAIWLGVITFAIVATAAGFYWFAHRAAPATSNDADAGAAEAAALARACDVMRERIHRGASFGDARAEGWVIELWLAGPEGRRAFDPAGLARFIADGRLTQDADGILAAITDGTAAIARAPEAEKGWTSVTILLRGGYARAYLEADARARYVALADRLADATGAVHGALYGRCAHLTARDLGAWFRGPDASAATASMLFTMGLAAEPPALDRDALAKLHKAGDLEAIKSASGKLGAADLTAFVAQEGGTVSGDRAVSITFPLTAPTRATVTSRAIAKKLGLERPTSSGSK